MKFIPLLALSLLMACPLQGLAQNRLTEKEVQFLEEAARTSMLEIQAGQLALQNTSQNQVKQYAQLILIEHEKIAGDLQGLSSTHEVKLPTELEGESIATLTDLQHTQGAAFDQRYIDKVAVGAHEDAVKVFQAISEETQNQDVNEFAKKSLPVLEEHLKLAREIARNR